MGIAEGRLPRASGLLLHPTSLPGPHGVGDLGEQGYRFVDFLVAASQSLWQVLPLGPTGLDDSPYSAHSAFAGNPLMVSLSPLHEAGLLDADELEGGPSGPPHRAVFQAARAFKMPRLRRAYERFVAAGREDDDDFAAFYAQAHGWLEDYALFMTLKEVYGGRAWNQWPTELAQRKPAVLTEARNHFAAEIDFHRFLQYSFHVQWSNLKRYANERSVRLVGDVPIFVAHDSADVWALPDQFRLDPNGRPVRVAGAPPDYFSATGQVWGNPLYDWDRQAANGFAWWVERFRAILQHVDLVRLDHFRGFHACWALYPDEQTAERGEWLKGPGTALFDAIVATLGALPMFVEDLGLITPEVDALREHLGYPGIRLLQWGFLDPASFHDVQAVRPDLIARHLPHNYQPSCVVYTSTHDTDTAVGWYAHLSDGERTRVRRYLGSDSHDISYDLLRLAMSSVADTVIVPLQDILRLGSEARMNVPARVGSNWCWRVAPDQLVPEHTAMLADLTEIYDRADPRSDADAWRPPSAERRSWPPQGV